MKSRRAPAASAAAAVVAAALGLMPLLTASAETPAERVLRAYPEAFTGIEAGALVTRRGVRIPIPDASTVGKSATARLDHADIADMFVDPYLPGAASTVPAFGADPGRARSKALFDALYGDCTRGEVSPHLVAVPWLPRRGGGTIAVTRLNGAADRLMAVARELDALPARFDVFLTPAAGGYHCRAIAGSARPSAHGWGIAVDIATARADYWRWGRGPPPAEGAPGLAYRNRIPIEIVEIFEKHGFIWGGKWYHFDTMHFEYRPELLPPLAPLKPDGTGARR